MEYVQIKILLDNIYTILKNGNNSTSVAHSHEKENPVDEDFIGKFDFPLKILVDLEDFNKLISTNIKYKHYLIAHYNKIGGVDGNKKGEKWWG